MSCGSEPQVSSVRADRILGDQPLSPPPPPDEQPTDAWEAPPSYWEAWEFYSDQPIVTVPVEEQEPEAAIHALASQGDGWLAAGSLTAPGDIGTAAVWDIDRDSSFGDATRLPMTADVPSVARDTLVNESGALVVGSQGSGRQSIPTVWRSTADGTWSLTTLPIDLAATYGAIADRVLRLDDGTIVVVGRGDGPFFSKLVLWSSIDDGATWSILLTDTRSFLEPLVATDGRQIALFFRTYPESATGLAGYATGLVALDGGALTWVGGGETDLVPGVRYWPTDLTWDGSQFVMALQVDVGPALATSSDGANYVVTTIDPPGLLPGVPAGAMGLALFEGSVVVLVSQQSMLSMFRWDGVTLTPIDLPPTPSGSLEYLDARPLISSDGERFAYLAADWDRLTLLTGDGEVWASEPVYDFPLHRNSNRLEIRDLVSVSGSELALLAESYSTEPGRFQSDVIGVLWRPNRSSLWEQYGLYLPDLSGTVAVAEWNDSFVIVGYEPRRDRSSLFQLDPNSGEIMLLSRLDGFVGSVVADANYIYARADDQVGGSVLWHSSDGFAWTTVDLGFEPRVMCTDGDIAVVEWMVSDGGTSTMGTARLDGASVTTYSSPFEFETFQVLDEQEQTLRCGVNDFGVLTTMIGFDSVIASQSPHTRLVNWTPPPTSDAELVLPMSAAGAWRSTVMDVEWSGSRWVAVGGGRDVESAWDALMWTSTDGLVWSPPVTVAGGPGNQMANTVTFEGGTMRLGGFDGTTATLWVLPG